MVTEDGGRLAFESTSAAISGQMQGRQLLPTREGFPWDMLSAGQISGSLRDVRLLGQDSHRVLGGGRYIVELRNVRDAVQLFFEVGRVKSQ